MLRVNRSSMYYEVKEPTEAQRLLKEELMGRIDYWHTVQKGMFSFMTTDCFSDIGVPPMNPAGPADESPDGSFLM